MRIASFKNLFKQRPVFFLLLGALFVLPFLDGGTSFVAEILILILPLPLFLLGLASGEIRFSRLPFWLMFSWFVFLVSVAFSVVGSASQVFSIPAFFQLLALFLFFTLFCLTVREEAFKQAVWFIFIISFALSLLGFYHLFPWVEKPAEMNLVYATFGHSHLADYLLLVIPFALALFLTAKRQQLKLFFGVLLIFYLISLILTFSRGAFLVLPAVVLLLIFLVKPTTAAKKLIGWLLVLIPLGLLFLIIIFSLSSFGVKARLAQPKHWLVKQLVKPQFQAKRLDYWGQALEGFKSRPLFGFGWGTFELVALRFQKNPVGWSDFTHNFYFQVLAEAGIFALLSFLTFLFYSFCFLWQQLKKAKTNPFFLGGLGAIIASSLHSLLDYDWHFPAVFLTFLFLLANLTLLKKEERVNRKLGKIYQWGLILLSLLVCFFAWTQLAGKYFYQKKDFEKALLFSPWPAVRVRQAGDKLFEKDFSQGEKMAQRLLVFSKEDPSMYYWLADKYYYASQLEKAAEYYQKAIAYNPLGNYRLYLRLGEVYDQLEEKEDKDELYYLFAQKLEKSKAFEKTNHALAKTLYLIGEGYLKEERGRETVAWWEKAARAAPEWSYFHIDLASLYLKLGDAEKAKKALEYCLTFYHPGWHCQEYQERLSEGRAFEPPGYWRGKILAIPD